MKESKESRRIPVNNLEAAEEGVVSDLVERAPERANQKCVEELTQTVSDLNQQLEGMEDRWKRSAADLDNYRKRFERELERLRLAEREMILREWLAVVDNMERALKAEKAPESPWYQGMKAIYQQMLGVLKLFGVQSFNPKGEPFDPQYHEAVATVNLDNEPEGIIAEVVEPGYTINDRILRPAKVIPVRRQQAD